MPKKTTVSFKDQDKGYKKLMASLGEMGTLTIGVQGEEAQQLHPQPTRWGGQDGSTVGEVAAIHELGLGVPRRSWLVAWMDENTSRMLKESQRALGLVLKGVLTRKAALAGLGYEWTKEIRDRVAQGKVTPRLSPTTVAIKGHDTPLVETYSLHNAITYKLFLPNKKSIRNTAQRAATRRRR